MNKDYCDYKLSFALKKAGFDEPCDHYYTPNKVMRIAKDNALAPEITNNRYLDEIDDGCCTAVPLWHAQKWLREKWGIAVSVQAREIQGELWYSADIVTTKGFDELVDGGFDYLGYEAALSAGLNSALDLLAGKEGEE